MRLKTFLTFISISFVFHSYPQQTDSIIGKVKKVREKVIFLTEVENPQLIYNDDYGHQGFRGPEVTKAVFKDNWYNRESSYYINYERHFDNQGKITTDYWFTKKDSLFYSYKYIYDAENRLIRENSTTDNRIITESYYYKKGGHLDIIKENSDMSYFFHKYQKYDDNENLTKELRHHSRGNTKEYSYVYDDLGNLIYGVTGNLIDWDDYKKNETRSKTSDSIYYFYKNIINTYNEENQLIKHQKFIRKIRNDSTRIEPAQTVQHKYQGENIIQTSVAYNMKEPFFTNFEYDDKNRLTARYCCSENKEEAVRVKQYKYDDKNIHSLRLTQHEQDDVKINDVEFSYKFDKKGNWIEILKTVDGVDRFKWVRTIEFYE